MTPERLLEIERIFHDALELAPERRADFVRQACAGDSDLIGQVESLLNQGLSTGGLPQIERPPTVGETLGRQARLQPGASVGPYEILSPIGAGGMGEVYKARDMRLKRTVAIKVLPPGSGRFLQEARAASMLNHPNIVTIHDIISDGHDCIVMEYVQGESLAEVMRRRPPSYPDVLHFATQIADALRIAHAAGIVHRDIKPGNIIVTPDMRVKVLDFGIAKLSEPAKTSATTGTLRPRTEAGAVLGTIEYMSPEQAEGKEVDRRSDIFSFGSVLYEMATGVRPFRGPNELATLAAIVHDEPVAPRRLAPALPSEFERIVVHCLRKDPSRRFQHIDDVKTLLEELKEEFRSSGAAARPQLLIKSVARRWRIVAAAVVVVASGIVVATWWSARDWRVPGGAPETALTRITWDSGVTTDPAISPDGKLVAYASDRASGDNLDIWVQQVEGGGTPLRLTSDPAEESEPVFSPDGTRIVFRSRRDGGGIYSIPALGGDQRLIARQGRHPAFSPDGTEIAFVAGPMPGGELFLVSLTGGAPRRLVGSPRGAASPVWSPDGKFVLFASGVYRIEGWSIARPAPPSAVDDVETEVFKKARLGQITPRQWLDGNRIVCSSKSGNSSQIIEAQLRPPISSRTGWRVESFRRLTFGTSFDESPSLAAATAGTFRRMAFASTMRTENIWSVALNPNHPVAAARAQRVTDESGVFQTFPGVSPDGKKVALITRIPEKADVWLLDLTTAKRSLLSTVVSGNKLKITQDGARVYYGDADAGFYVVPVAGGPPERLCPNVPVPWPWHWSPDSTRILHLMQGKSSVGAGILNVETCKDRMYLERPADVYEFQWSPDQRWLAFALQAAGRQIFVGPFEGDAAPAESAWIPITDGTTWEDKLRWSPDGNWIYSSSDQDGFLCVWAYRLDPRTKKPTGSPVAVFHSHGSRVSLRSAINDSMDFAVARDKIVFNQGEVTSNIWMTTITAK